MPMSAESPLKVFENHPCLSTKLPAEKAVQFAVTKICTCFIIYYLHCFFANGLHIDGIRTPLFYECHLNYSQPFPERSAYQIQRHCVNNLAH